MPQLPLTLKVLEKHAKILKALLAQHSCDNVFTGTNSEDCATRTQTWFISEGIDESYLSVEKVLEDLCIPYDRVCHGPGFKLLSYRHFRIDSNQQALLYQCEHGDNTLELLDELEAAIAGNDYTFARIFITKKRNEHLCHLDWSTQDNFSTELEVA